MKNPFAAPSTSEQPWMHDDLGIRNFGYSVVGLFLFVTVAWAAFAPIESAAIAPGVVQVEGNTKPIQHLEGGRVSKILVALGESVVAGQPLLLLDAKKDRAEKEILQGRIFNLVARVARLKSERDGLKAPDYPEEIVDFITSDSRAENAAASENSLFYARLAALNGEKEVITSQIDGFTAVAISKQQVVDSLRFEITDLQALLEEGYADKTRLRQLERSNANALGELADLQVKIKESSLKIMQLEKRFKTEVVNELTQAEEGLYDLRQQYAAVNDRVVRATVTAPIPGVVLSIKPNTVGAVVGPGEIVMEIVPQIDSLVVEARVDPLDIDRVSLGQEAEVRFAVFKDAFLISGRLAKLSADRMIDTNTDTPYYRAEIELVTEDLVLLEGMSLVPGMPAEVLIKTGERTMLGYLTSPLRRIFSRSLRED